MKKQPGNKMQIIGLTGGIGMGKSAAAEILKQCGLPIYSADDAVHALMAKNGAALPKLKKLFPLALKNGVVDRKILGLLVFNNKILLKKLEAILHPLVHKVEKEFLAKAKKAGKKAAVLEIPLLFETGAQKRCDFTICVTASKAVQKARVMARPGMTEMRFHAILKRQMDDAKKRKKADYVVQTGKDLADTKHQLEKILKAHHLI